MQQVGKAQMPFHTHLGVFGVGYGAVEAGKARKSREGKERAWIQPKSEKQYMSQSLKTTDFLSCVIVDDGLT